LKQEVSKRNSYSQICSLYSELEKLKEESKILKKIENFQREKKQDENFHNVYSTYSNLRNSKSNDQDGLMKNFKNVGAKKNTNGYNLITSTEGNSYGSVFCFP
jgi:hypothetical protein